MNPTDILNRKPGPETWYLQSRYVADRGLEKVAAEIETQCAEKLGTIKSKYAGPVGLRRGELLHHLKYYLQYGANGGVPLRVPNVLADFYASVTAEAKRRFYLTNIGSQVWETLDWCLEERRPCFIEGHTGRGKTTAARAWHEAHRGESRYISLSGLRTRRSFFEALAAAYGVNFSEAKATNEICFRITEMIVRSGLVPILDEAHHALPERQRASRPQLIDWIDCDLCNAGVPVALISTPQFGPMLSEFEDRTKWNAGQFRRRFSGRWTCLPEVTREADLEHITKAVLPNVGSRGVDLAVGYAGTFGRDVSGLFDLVRDAESRARKAKHSTVTFQDLKDAHDLDRVPTENAMANAFKRPTNTPLEDVVDDTLPDESETAAAPLPRHRIPEAADTNRLRSTPDGDLVSV